jgi:hypothetical protein
MKKFFLLIGLSILSFATFAEKVPTVIVNKSQGGFTAVLNLYNYVSYTPPESTGNGVGRLDCSGSGFSPCRIPNCSSFKVNVGNTVMTVTDPVKMNAFKAGINDVIAEYENALANSIDPNMENSSPKSIPTTYTKTIALSKTNKGSISKNGNDTYVVRGVVSSSNGANSTMKIYIEQVNLLSPVGLN